MLLLLPASWCGANVAINVAPRQIASLSAQIFSTFCTDNRKNPESVTKKKKDFPNFCCNLSWPSAVYLSLQIKTIYHHYHTPQFSMSEGQGVPASVPSIVRSGNPHATVSRLISKYCL